MSKYWDALEKIEHFYNDREDIQVIATPSYKVLVDAVEKAQAFDIIKKKQVNVFGLILVECNKENQCKWYNDSCCILQTNFLTEEEFDFLKEMLGNE